MRFDIERTSTAVCRSRVMRVTPCFVGAGSGIGATPAMEGGGEGAGDDEGARGRNAAREKAEEVRKRWNGSGSDIANTCDAGRYSFSRGETFSQILPEVMHHNADEHMAHLDVDILPTRRLRTHGRLMQRPVFVDYR